MRSKSLAALGVAAAMVVSTVALSAVLLTGTAGASAKTLYVSTSGSNGGNSCQQSAHPCQTITYALSVSVSGGIIKLLGGTYNEQVTITKPITIEGAGDTQSIIKPSAVPEFDSDTDSTQPQFYVVDVKNVSGVTLEDLGINGSAATPTLDTNGHGCAQDYVGVYYHDASGTLTDDAVSGIELPADLFGCQGGQGIYVDTDRGSASPSSVTVKNDVVNTYDKNGITCDDPATYCTISGTTVSGIGSTPLIAQNGIQIWASGASLTSNTVVENTYDGPDYAASGILIGNPSTLTLSKNVALANDSDIYLIQDQSPAWVYCGNTSSSCTNPAAPNTTFTFSKNTASYATNVYPNPVGTGYGDGLDIDSSSTSTSVVQNTVNNDPGNGISLYGPALVTLSKNTLATDGNGIYLGSGTASTGAYYNTILSNTVTGATTDGILADTSSAFNLLQTNTISSSASEDIRDNSTGSGTENTANAYSSNKCSTSLPAGLCLTTKGHHSADAASAALAPAAKPKRVR
jgi:hypothetical protein